MLGPRLKKDEEEAWRIYSQYTIDFVAKLEKEIYHGDVFGPNNFDVNRLYYNLFNKVKKTINLETHKLI
jgi:hypothetical protein